MPLSTTNSSWHSPSNAHAYRLLIFKELDRAAFAAPTKKRDSDSVWKPCQPLSAAFRVCLSAPASAAEPVILARRGDRVNPCLLLFFASAGRLLAAFASAKPSTIARVSSCACALCAADHIKRAWSGSRCPVADWVVAVADGQRAAWVKPCACVVTTARSPPARWLPGRRSPARGPQPWRGERCRHAAPAA